MQIKELHPNMPVINVISVMIEKKQKIGMYDCPVYYTTFRGPTYIFMSNLKMESEDTDPGFWVLNGCAMILCED